MRPRTREQRRRALDKYIQQLPCEVYLAYWLAIYNGEQPSLRALGLR